jgi:hypothetical protein
LTKEPLHDLTGAPARTFWCYSKDKNFLKYEDVWLRICAGELDNNVMTCGTIDVDTD